jgi:hypothetical protein
MTTDFANPQKFKNVLNKRTIALSYTGTEGDLEVLKGYISQLPWTKKLGVKAAGLYEHGGRWAYVSTTGAVAAGGAPVPDIVQMERYKGASCGLPEAKPLNKDGLSELGEYLLTYNEPAKAVSILAWATGCFIKPHLRLSGIKFPHLFLIGEAGSGKSNTLERVILPIFSKAKVNAASQVTAFTLMKEAASSNLAPLFLDEFKPSKTDKLRLNALYNHFRDSYDGHEGVRGRVDQTAVSYELLAPLAVAGEESSDEAAVRERSVELLFSKKDLKSKEHRYAFGKICARGDLLRSLGRSLLDTALASGEREIKNWHEEAAAGFSPELPSRVVNNLACCLAGLLLVEKFALSQGIAWTDVFPFRLDMCHKYLELAAKEYLLDGSVANRSTLEEAFEVMSRMRLVYNEEYAFEKDGTVLCLWLNRVYDLYTKYRRDHAISGEVLNYPQFKKQLAHSDVFLASNVAKRFGEDVRKVWLVDYELLKARCDVSGFENTEAEPL